MSGAAVLDAGTDGSGAGPPPEVGERTPDGFGDGGDWEQWLRQFDPELAELLTVERVKDVGRGVTSIVEAEIPLAAGHVAASAYVTPTHPGIRQVAPGFYILN